MPLNKVLHLIFRGNNILRGGFSSVEFNLFDVLQ